MSTTHSLGMKAVRDCLVLLELPGLDAARVEAQHLLIEDLGLSSLNFIDLTLGLEDQLGREFPMQEWIDQCIEDGQAITVGALASAFERQVAHEVA